MGALSCCFYLSFYIWYQKINKKQTKSTCRKIGYFFFSKSDTPEKVGAVGAECPSVETCNKV